MTRPDHVWCAYITYIPVQRGFLYLVAIMDWATRCVLAWRLSNTMYARFCIEALNEALAEQGRPEIFNTDQGSQFTSIDFTDALKDAEIAISMDGGPLPKQRLYRTPLAVAEIRGRLTPRDDQRLHGRARHRRVDRVLHHRATALRP